MGERGEREMVGGRMEVEEREEEEEKKTKRRERRLLNGHRESAKAQSQLQGQQTRSEVVLE